MTAQTALSTLILHYSFIKNFLMLHNYYHKHMLLVTVFIFLELPLIVFLDPQWGLNLSFGNHQFIK